MFRSIFMATALAIALPITPAGAQTASADAAAPDPARLAAAKALIGKIMPADERDAMIDRMLRPTMENMRVAMMESPMFDTAKEDNPEFAETMDEFVNAEFERSIALTKAAMPQMLDAMALAYARRFTLDELAAISAFFETPAGRAYVTRAPTVMSDPDVLAAQRAMMTEAMAGLEERAQALVERLSGGEKKD